MSTPPEGYEPVTDGMTVLNADGRNPDLLVHWRGQWLPVGNVKRFNTRTLTISFAPDPAEPMKPWNIVTSRLSVDKIAWRRRLR